MKWWRLATTQAVTGLNGTVAGKAPKLELGQAAIKAKMQARGIDERCSLSGFTVTRRDGDGKHREKEGKRETTRQVGSAHPRLGGT